MQQTTSKALARSFFYQEFLPAQLSPELMRGGNFLILLGADKIELDLIQSLGVPPYRVYSVERDDQTSLAQAAQSRRGQLGINIYYGTVAEFAAHYLRTNARFLVLNLDIYGAYLTSLHPAMRSVLQFARLNPRTVIATYSNCNRDRPQLKEGLTALALFLWLDRQATQEAVEHLYGRYRAVGLDPSVSLNMVLRHLFWLRSHLEHIAETADESSRLPGIIEKFWTGVCRRLPETVDYGTLLSAVAGEPGRRRFPAELDVRIRQLQAVTYEGINVYHTGWFCSYEPGEPVTPREWLHEALRAVTERPLRFARASDEALRAINGARQPVDPSLIVWTGQDLGQRRATGRRHLPPAETEEPQVPQDPKDLSDLRPQIRELAAEGLDSQQIQAKLPRHVPIPRLAGFVANARRSR